MTLAELEAEFDDLILPHLHLSHAAGQPMVQGWDIFPAKDPEADFQYIIKTTVVAGSSLILDGLNPWKIKRKLYLGCRFTGFASRTLNAWVKGYLKGAQKFIFPCDRNKGGLSLHFGPGDYGTWGADVDDEAICWKLASGTIQIPPLRACVAIDKLEFFVNTVSLNTVDFLLGCYSETIT